MARIKPLKIKIDSPEAYLVAADLAEERGEPEYKVAQLRNKYLKAKAVAKFKRGDMVEVLDADMKPLTPIWCHEVIGPSPQLVLVECRPLSSILYARKLNKPETTIKISRFQPGQLKKVPQHLRHLL